MAATGTGNWIQFFKDAGLPSSAAATYALTFAENRIRMDMLLDLNKEILKDMHINLMGDVIAILRHARRVHDQTACEKVLADAPSTPSLTIKNTANLSVRSSSPSNSTDSGKSTPKLSIGDTTPKQPQSAASRMVHHYTRQAEPVTTLPNKISKVEGGPAKVSKMGPVIKRKVKAREIALPVKKPRRVLPEHEGRYKITMPSGSTPRTQQILAKQGLLPAKKTVFERLGEGSVSSTTGADSPLITITGLGNNIVKNNTDKSSVFSRLGDKQRVTSSTTPDLQEEEEEDDMVDDDGPSPYVGVLKLPVKKAVMTKKIAVTPKKEEATMRADAELPVVIKKREILKSRLGSVSAPRVVKQSGMSSTIVKPGATVKYVKLTKKVKNKTAGILANPTNATKMSVKSRLGGSSEDNPTTTVVKRKPEHIVFNAPAPSTIKSVRFAQVTQEVYDEEPVQSTVHPRITMNRKSVFGRLGT